jgi:tRNA 2-selenouridine synthase
MFKIESVEEFLNLGEKHPIIDVRSPLEYNDGHISNAVNVPLFDNDERVQVGTTYVQTGREEAVELGLEFALPKLSLIYKSVKELIKDKNERKVLLHCWRGGMRSASVASFLEICGVEVFLLVGGYKSFRRELMNSFEKDVSLSVIGGMTGSGKTDLLKELADSGHQVIDLEGLANHMGSAFGGIRRVQPTSEQFTNEIYHIWRKFDFSKPIFIEDESINIGKCVLPESLYEKMRTACLIVIENTKENRVKRIVRDYGAFDKTELVNSCNLIKNKLGAELYNNAVNFIETNDISAAVSLLLDYYDKKYDKGIKRRGSNMIKIKFDENENFALLIDELTKIMKIF